MKKLLLSILILFNSSYQLFSCGYYPFGEATRYYLTIPSSFNYDGYHSFDYNFYRPSYIEKDSPDANIMDWHNFTNKKVSIKSIQEFMNSDSLDFQANSSNEFIQYLYKNNKNSAINYLKNAKKHEGLNVLVDENWERGQEDFFETQLEGLNELKKELEKESNPTFKRKYAFLCIRLAYYTGEFDLIRTLFGEYFENETKDYLYYWSLYFHSFTKRPMDNLVDVANIFTNSSEKAYATYHFFDEKWKLDNAIVMTEDDTELANIYAFASVQQSNQALENLKMIYEKNPQHHLLGFLVLRELSKLEDWIFTPYYTNFSPSLLSEYETNLLERSEEDRIYAQKVLDFIHSIDIKQVKKPMVWQYAEIELLFMTRHYGECLEKINLFEKSYNKEKCIQEVEKIKAFCLVTKQEKGNAIITKELQTLILKYSKDARFIFSLGRELEYKGNLLDGIALISIHTKKDDYNGMTWRSITAMNDMAYFYDYFDYIDFAYSSEDLKKLLTKIRTLSLKTDFDKLLYSTLVKEKNYLGDLLGTKYVRENNLQEALKVFESVGQKYWDENYNPWERDKYDEYMAFDQNPFYKLKHTDDFIQKRDTFLVTKLSITKHLIDYLALANNPQNADRDYYYFIVANCYLNMTNSGHSWMMRRFSGSYWQRGYVDEEEYSKALLAQKYYQLAFESAKTKKFKALCLRMMDYAVSNSNSTHSKRVKNEYPEFFSELSGCIYFEEFFNARR